MRIIFQQPNHPRPTSVVAGSQQPEGFEILAPAASRPAAVMHEAGSATRFLEHAQESRGLPRFVPEPDTLFVRAQKYLRAKVYGQWTRLIDDQIMDDDLKAKLHEVCDNSALKRLDDLILQSSEKNIRDVQTLLQHLSRIMMNQNVSAEISQLVQWLDELCVRLGLQLTVTQIKPGLTVPRITVLSSEYNAEHAEVMLSVQKHTQQFNARGFLYDESGQPRTAEQYQIFWEEVVQLIPEQYLSHVLFQFSSQNDLINFIKAVYTETTEDHFLNLRLTEALLGMRHLETSTSEVFPYRTEDLWHDMLADSATQGMATALLITSLIYGNVEQSRDMMELYERLAKHHLGEWHQSFHQVAGDLALAPTAKPAGFVIMKQTHEWIVSHNTLEERFIIAYRGLSSTVFQEFEHAFAEAEFLLRTAYRLTRSQTEVLAARILALMDRNYTKFKTLLNLLAVRLHDESDLKSEVLETLRIRAVLDVSLSKARLASAVGEILKPYLMRQDAHSTYALQKGIEWSQWRNLDMNIQGHAMGVALGLSRAGAASFSRIPNMNLVSFAGLPMNLEQMQLVLSSGGAITGVVLTPTLEELWMLDQSAIQPLQNSGARVTSQFLERMLELELILPTGIDLSHTEYKGRIPMSDEQLLWCLRNQGDHRQLGVQDERLATLHFTRADIPILTRILRVNPSNYELTGQLNPEQRLVLEIIKQIQSREIAAWYCD